MADTTFIAGTPIVSPWLNDVNDAAYNGSAVFTPEGSGAIATTMQDKFRETRSLFDWLSPALVTIIKNRSGYTGANRIAVYNALTLAWNAALAGKFNLYAPSGLYDVGENSLPFGRINGLPPVSLLDCFDITIYGEGPSTVFQTNSVNGADVLQINGAKNLHFNNFKITNILTGTLGAGSNGISITGGYDNISILDVWIENCAGLDKTTYIDGGKGLTMQCDGATLEVGSLKARIFVDGCAQGFGFEAGLFNFLTKKIAVDIDIVASNCFHGVSISAPEATGAIPAGTHIGVKVRGQAINCQKSVAIVRGHGVEVDIQAITTKTEAARRLSPTGGTWFAADTVVEGLLCTYAKNSQVTITGNVGACAHKARIGGTTAGSSGLTGSTEHSQIFIDLAGTASVANITSVDSGGNTVANSTIVTTLTTTATFPAAFYTASNNNMLVIGPVNRLITPQISGSLSLRQGTTGNIETGLINIFGNITGLQGKVTSTGGAVIAGLYDSGGTFRFGILNGNGIVVDALGSGSALGAYIGKHPVYNSAGTLIGWFPVYA